MIFRFHVSFPGCVDDWEYMETHHVLWVFAIKKTGCLCFAQDFLSLIGLWWRVCGVCKHATSFLGSCREVRLVICFKATNLGSMNYFSRRSTSKFLRHLSFIGFIRLIKSCKVRCFFRCFAPQPKKNLDWGVCFIVSTYTHVDQMTLVDWGAAETSCIFHPPFQGSNIKKLQIRRLGVFVILSVLRSQLNLHTSTYL